MKLTPPFPLSTIVQGFGSNAVNYQNVDGTIGHPGIDFAVPWGTPIPAAIESKVSALLSPTNPNPMAYKAVNTIYEDEIGCYEIQYGHCSSITASVGQNLAPREAVGLVGNTGEVFVGNREVTAQEKLAGSHAGAHLHFQVRVIKKVPKALQDPTKHYLNDGTGLLSIDGYIYEIPDFLNGYNGCVDPAQFFLDSQIIKDEVAVLNKQTDLSVRQGLTKLIISQAKQFLGFK